MGTNYYVPSKKCQYCGHKPDDIHLGKLSWGWDFSYQYNDGKYYENREQMKEWLKDKKIKDEYGKSISPRAFWIMLDQRHSEKDARQHCELYNDANNFMLDGYSFSNVEFC